MALIIADRVKETTSTAGTGAYTLAGAVAGFQAFSVVTSNADTVYYAITDDTNWEVGIGTYTASGNTLARTTVLSSSNSGNSVNWGAGAKDIFLTYPSNKAVYLDSSGNIASPLTTDKLAQGSSNLYYSNGSVDTHLSGGTGVVYNSGAISIGQAVGTGDAVSFSNVSVSANPTTNLQLATKQYVDTIAAAGIHYHTPARAQAIANLNATYSNGSSGVGATLTNAGTQAALVLDGVSLSATNRVMIQEQTNKTHNGVYTVTTVGNGSTNWVLTRATDADSYAPSDSDALGQGDAFFITDGTVHGGELDVMTTQGVITFGTTNIIFALVSDSPIYTAGTGMALSGTQFSIGQAVGTGSDVVFNTVTAPVTGTVSSLANHDTADLAEGSNLYYTAARTNSAIDTRVNQAFVNGLNVDAEALDGATKAVILATAQSESLALAIALG